MLFLGVLGCNCVEIKGGIRKDEKLIFLFTCDKIDGDFYVVTRNV